MKLRILVLSLLIPAIPHAADGVLEINQSCAATGCFAGDVPDFPVTITQPGSYRLTGNLVNTTVPVPHVEILSSYVTLDLGGFEVRGPQTCIGTPPGCTGDPNGLGIAVDAVSRHHVVVRNGTVRGTTTRGIELGERATVEDLHVDDVDGRGIQVGDFGSVQHSTVVSTTGIGILMGNISRAAENVVMSVGSSGIQGGDGCVISGNTVASAQTTGIVVGGGSLINLNTILDSTIALFCSPRASYGNNVLFNNAGTTSSADGNQGVGGVCLEIDTNQCGLDLNCP